MNESFARRYRDGGVFGTLAYDFAPPAPEEVARPPRSVPAARTAPTAKSARWLSWLLLGLFGALALLLLTAAIFGRMRLTALDDRAAAAEKRVTALREQQAALRLEYEQTFTLDELEARARDQLGMQQPRGDQLRCVDTQTADKATVLQPEPQEGPAAWLRGLAEAVLECFRP